MQRSPDVWRWTEEARVPEQRRLDRILADDYLDGLDSKSPDELRVMRRECQGEESTLSFGRRVLHGRLDVVRAELQRRAVGGSSELSTLLAQLAEDGDAGTSTRSASHLSIDQPNAIVLDGKRALDLTDEPLLARLSEATDDELHDAVDRWLALERQISRARTNVHRQLDAIQSALVSAYRSGTAHVDDVLRGAGG